MTYKLAEPSFDITSGSNWITLLKFWGINILVSIVVTMLIIVILRVFISGGTAAGYSNDDFKGAIGGAVKGGVVSMMPIVLVILMGQMYTLSLFEKYDGCYKKIE